MTCASNYDDCNATVSDGCEANLATTAKHCGFCARDCLDGPCSSGLCAPIEIPTGGDLTARAVAVDLTNVYWTNVSGSSVQYRPKVGGGPIISLATGQPSPYWLVLVGTNLYWTTVQSISGKSYGSILSVSVGGGTVSTVVSLQQGLGGSAVPFTADAQYVYWLGQPGSQQFLSKTTVDGTSTQSIGTIPFGSSAFGMTSSGATLWWTIVYSSSGNGEVWKVPSSGGTATIEASGQQLPSGIVYYGGKLLWVTGATSGGAWNDGAIMKLDTATGTPSVLVSGEHNPRQITTDGVRVFWSTENPSYIRQVTLSGGAAMSLTASGGVGANLVADDKYVYWTNSRLYKVAKYTGP